MRPSVIAIDYDGTYTVDPDLWRAFIERWIEDHPETVCKPPPILSKERTAQGACGTCHADLAARSITTGTDRVFVFYCPRCENDDLTRLARSASK